MYITYKNNPHNNPADYIGFFQRNEQKFFLFNKSMKAIFCNENFPISKNTCSEN